MNTPTDGGPAFPQSVSGHDGPTASYDFVDGGGMTLRDYFAAKAMIALMSSDRWVNGLDQHAGMNAIAFKAALASQSFMMADEMLKERTK
jgi:hypothetical protein